MVVTHYHGVIKYAPRASKGQWILTIGVRPDQFMTYLRNADVLHRLGANAQLFRLLSIAAALPRLTAAEEAQLEAELETLTQPRREIVQVVRRQSRLGNFKQQVLLAYGNRCVVTGAQLRLIDAAHILPVGAPGSIDHVRNGLALSPTYHRAYDNTLIFLDDSYTMRINRRTEHALRQQNLIQGLDAFSRPLGRIHLPPDQNQWPSRQFIQRANAHRRIQA